MFTGLIKTLGEVRRIDQRGDRIITIAMREPFDVEIGDSVACNGICLTAINVMTQEFKVSLSAETLAHTTAEHWDIGTIINLEPSLTMGDKLGGHLVAGHVDGVGRAIRRESTGDSTLWEFAALPPLGKFIAPKGSITIDGVSLTVNSVTDQKIHTGIDGPLTLFTVNIIPHTAKMTNFGRMEVDDTVNLEMDMLARYVARMQEYKA